MKRYLFIDGPLNGGGAERVLIDIFRNFDYEHNEVTLLQINAGGTLIDEVPSQVRIVSAWSGYTRGYSFAYRCSQWMAWDYPLRSQLLKVLQGRHYDVSISFLEGMPLKMHALITSVADRNYSWVHCDLDTFRYEEKQFRKGEEIAAYNIMDAVVCVAKDTGKAFLKRFPTCAAPVKVIYNPIDCSKIIRMSEAELTIPDIQNHFTISVVGRLTPQKKLDRVIRLARRIKDEGLSIKILIIGDGELKDELIQAGVQLDVQDVVEFVGFQRNPYPYIKKSDLLLSTSGYEGFSLVICEAMALGVPVVATKTAGPMEILDNNTYGLLCDHDDESIFQSVKKMYDDEKLRRNFSQVGRERVKDFSVRRAMSAINDL